MNFIPNEHELYLITSGISRRERERERDREREREREKFCVINVKYKEISWRVRKEEEEEKSLLEAPRNLCLKI